MLVYSAETLVFSVKRYSKKGKGQNKAEAEVLQWIRERNIAKLQLLLEGLGNGRICVGLSSNYLLQQWYNYLESVANGSNEIVNSNSLLFKSH